MKNRDSIHKKLVKIAITGLLVMLLVSVGSSADLSLQKDASKKSVGSGSARPDQLKAYTHIPMPLSPRGILGSTNPTFRWTKVAGVTQYTLKLRDPSGVITLKTLNLGDDFEINGPNCEWLSDLPAFTAGTYIWWIRANLGTGSGPWSASAAFRIAELPPTRTTPLSPSGLTSAKVPLFVWSAAPGATHYTLQVDNASSEGGEILNLVDISADEVTRGNKCSLRSPIPLSGVLFWRVQAHNDFGDGTMSGYRYFEIVCGCGGGLSRAQQAQQTVTKCQTCSRKG